MQGLRYYSMIDCGYGYAALAYMEGLLERNIPIRWSPLVITQWGLAPWRLLPDHLRPEISEMAMGAQNREAIIQCLEQDVEYDTVLLHCMPEIWSKLLEPDHINIGYTVWETDRLPSHWPEILHTVNHICVPCTYNQALFSIENGPPVSVVPHAIRNSLPENNVKHRQEYRRGQGIPDDMYIFYLIATWVPRKAMLETLHAFLRAFTAEDNVCLLVKTDESAEYVDRTDEKRSTREIVDELKANYSNPAKIVLITGRIADRDMQLIHEIGDCFFSLTHCEGWGLSALDAAVEGNMVIITGWGGQLDYLPEKYCHHVSFALSSLQEIKGWDYHDSSQRWAYADMDDAVRLLRFCYTNQNAEKEKGQKLKSYVRNRFTVDQVTPAFLDAIEAAHKR